MNINKWKKFKISDYFDVKRGSRIVKNRDYLEIKNNEYKYNVITSTTVNNSVDGYFNKYNCLGNVITCGGEATGMFSTYQKDKCWVMDRSRILEPKFLKFNKHIGLFLITIFNLYQVKYSYGKSANPNDILNTIIKLPIDKDGIPDWKYMENYIKQLPYSKFI